MPDAEFAHMSLPKDRGSILKVRSYIVSVRFEK